MDEVSNILHELSGTVYTGCDLNTSMEDMEYLVGRRPPASCCTCSTTASAGDGEAPPSAPHIPSLRPLQPHASIGCSTKPTPKLILDFTGPVCHTIQHLPALPCCAD